MSESKTCQNCGYQTDPDERQGIWCPKCRKSIDPEETKEVLGSMKIQSFIGGQSLSPAMERFNETGDPAVFAKKGALDYDPALSVDK